MASSTDYYDNEAYDGWSDHWHINLSVANSSSDNWWVDIIYASTASVSCNQVVYASDKWTITHNYIDKIITLEDNRWYRAVISDRNAWATDIFEFWDSLTHEKCWDLFQWWNWNWFDIRWGWTLPGTLQKVCATWYWPQNPYQENLFVKDCTWDTCYNADLWWWVSAPRWDLNNLILSTHIANWFHIPSSLEIDNLWNVFNYIVWLSNSGSRDYSRAADLYEQYLFMPCVRWQSNFIRWWYWTNEWWQDGYPVFKPAEARRPENMCPGFANFIRPVKSVSGPYVLVVSE